MDFKDIDIVHTNSNRDCLGAMLAKKYKKPHVWHLREFGREDYDLRYLMPNYIHFMNTTTDYFVAISDAVKRAWVDKGLKEERIYRIYDGITLPQAETIQKADAFHNRGNKNTLHIAYLGIVCPSKGQLDATKALSYLDLNIVQNIKLDFWGDYKCLPEFTHAINAFAEKHGYPEAISFKGFTDNIWNELPKYDAAMVCSRSEAFGRITPEYMSLGLQVIASDSGANPELIEDGVSGYIYKQADLKDLAEKIKQVYIQNTTDWKKISNNAKLRVEIFSDTNHAKNMYSFYRRIVH
ncbi:MAG: glycosyltransferase family 4 protein [Lachnospiraceae bacterium]|nr:glycosyltransferase family 4 protein [Lachnospiraceae bacterium]